MYWDTETYVMVEVDLSLPLTAFTREAPICLHPSLDKKMLNKEYTGILS